MLNPLPTGYQRGQTSHAFLCAAGYFAQSCGLIRAVRSGFQVKMKTVDHSPPDKLLTFFLYTLAGLEALPEAEKGHHPLRNDPLLAQSWDQEELPYHTGISILLQRATEANVQELRQILDQVSEPFLRKDIQAARAEGTVTIILDPSD